MKTKGHLTWRLDVLSEPKGTKGRYLCLKRSPPCISSAFSRLSMAILQVRLAFRHEVWLLEEEGSHMRFWCHHQVAWPNQSTLPGMTQSSTSSLSTSSSW